MKLTEAEITFNQTWVFLQFRYYNWTFHDIECLVKSGLGDGNDNPLPFNVYDHTKIHIKEDTYSNRTRGCVLMQIEINEEQYSLMKENMPDLEQK